MILTCSKEMEYQTSHGGPVNVRLGNGVVTADGRIGWCFNGRLHPRWRALDLRGAIPGARYPFLDGEHMP